MTKAELEAENMRLVRELGKTRQDLREVQEGSANCVVETLRSRRLRNEEEAQAIRRFYKEQEEIVIDKMTKAVLADQYSDLRLVLCNVDGAKTLRAIDTLSKLVFRTFFEDEL